MRSLLFIALVLWLVWPAVSGAFSAQITYDIDTTGTDPGPYGATADRSWATFDDDGAGPNPPAPHLRAVRIEADGQEIVTIVDNPSDRTTPYISIDNSKVPSPRPGITLREVYLQQPWQAGTAYAVGDRISVFHREVTADGVTLPGFPDITGAWECTRAGTSGASEPDWPAKISFDNGGVVLDYGSGTVGLPAAGHPVVAVGDTIDIIGTDNYNGVFTLPAQNNADADHIEIAAPFVAETISGATYRLRVNDPDTGGAEWKYVNVLPVVGQSTPTGRIIAKDRGDGVAVETGRSVIIKGILRSAP